MIYEEIKKKLEEIEDVNQKGFEMIKDVLNEIILSIERGDTDLNHIRKMLTD